MNAILLDLSLLSPSCNQPCISPQNRRSTSLRVTCRGVSTNHSVIAVSVLHSKTRCSIYTNDCTTNISRLPLELQISGIVWSLTMDLIVVLMLLSLGCVKGQFFEDRRCRCVCPSPASILNTTNTRQIYTGNVPPNLCHCEGVVFPLLRNELEGKVHIFCPRCECIYQTRNTTLIMAIVFMILSAITMIVLYLMSFTWLKCLMRRQDMRPDDRDYIREYRGEFVRQRELERQRERNRLRGQRDASSDSDEAGVLLLDDQDSR